MPTRAPATPAPQPLSGEAPWSQEEARLLLRLREAAGLNEAVFANANAISLAQLRALEDRGSSPFYSEPIKAQLGRRLLRRLGHVPSAPEPAATPARPVTPVPSAPGEARPDPVELPRPASEDDPFVIPLSPNRRARGLLTIAVALVALVCVAWALGALQQRPAAPSASAAAPAPAPAATPALATASEPATAAAAPVPTEAAVCDGALRAQALAFMPDRALKGAGYVHVEATGPVSLCVIDARDRRTMAELRAGDSRSISGEPPFLVRVEPAQAVRVYFQGIRAPLASGDPSVTLLQARPAP